MPYHIQHTPIARFKRERNWMKLKEPYDSLNSHERMVLYLKANERDDEQEQQRIIAASNKNQNDCPDFFSGLHALHVTHLFHCARQLNLLLDFFKLWTRRENVLAGMWCCVRARQYVVNQEAWLSICDESGAGREFVLTNMNRTFRKLGNKVTDEILRSWALSDDDYVWLFDLFADTETPLPKMPTVAEEKREYERSIAYHRRLIGIR